MAAHSDENKRSPLRAWVRALERTAQIGRDPALTLPVLIGRLADRRGDAPALIATDHALSYRSLASACHRYGRWGLERRLGRGDTVALMMENCPEYLATWLGLTGIGVTVALINTHLRGELLAHSLKLASPRCLIVSPTLTAAVDEIRAQLTSDLECWVTGPAGEDQRRLDLAVASLAGDPPPLAPQRAPALADRALLIYTSGTTGLPKAANVSHLRLMQWSQWFAGLLDVQPQDRMYDCLPLYHSVGGVVAPGATLVGGGAVVVRKRFSAASFWKDVVAERCTLLQYIGELCRYLLLSPSQPEESQHSLRIACGNGLRADVWRDFQQRFGIPEILEYYAATEGNFSLYNCEGRVGSVGRIPTFLEHRLPVALVEFDVESAAPLRDAHGRCLRCAPGEVGEALGEIVAGDSGMRFEGYTDPRASADKILRDVFAPGDAWFRSGDLMRRDKEGFFYFVDRVGETFRWQGENVSTTEVETVIGACAGVSAAAVYGVPVPYRDGRAGMAALVVGAEFDLGALRSQLVARLPAYARPRFVRIVPALDLTATFKLNKRQLALEGYDPARVRDALYIEDAARAEYVRLDAKLYKRLVAGSVRL